MSVLSPDGRICDRLSPTQDQGIPGEQGPKGDTGPQGPVGPKGDTGNTGPKGDTGVAADLSPLLQGKQDILTTAQLAAVNSGITAAKVSEYDSRLAGGDKSAKLIWAFNGIQSGDAYYTMAPGSATINWSRSFIFRWTTMSLCLSWDDGNTLYHDAMAMYLPTADTGTEFQIKGRTGSIDGYPTFFICSFITKSTQGLKIMVEDAPGNQFSTSQLTSIAHIWYLD
jgi:hypothetical protein